MADYRLSIAIFSRGGGASAVAKAAYRAAECIASAYDGRTHDYTRKRGVVHKEILLPENAPSEYADRAVLWNAVEKSERYKTAQLAREIQISLPRELTREQNIALARRFVNEVFVKAGMCADLCVHDNDDGNPHAHIMFTMRPIEKDGTWGQKSKSVNGRKTPTVDWNEHERAEDWRKAWAAYQNAALRINGHDAVVDHRSYARQGIDQIPTVHLGPAASRMEKKGIRTERGDINRAIEITNREWRQLKARLSKLEKWVSEEASNARPPTLADVLDEVMSRQGQSSLTRLKNGVEIFNFLMDNKVNSMEDLEKKVSAMQDKLSSTRTELKKVERRIGTLKEHIMHSENYKNFRKIKTRYEELYSQYTAARKLTGFGAERKAQKALDAANAYYDTHRLELAMFDNAEQYLRDVLQERFDPNKLPPISKWRNELAVKTTEKDSLYREYYTLKDETARVEKIKRSVTEILHSETKTSERIPMRTLGMDV